jgi:hypothetical protein
MDLKRNEDTDEELLGVKRPKLKPEHSPPSSAEVKNAWSYTSTPLIMPSWHRDIFTLSRGPFAKFVDSLYYSESELFGGAVTVSFSKYLPWQAMHFLQRSNHFSKTCCRPLITSKFLASEFPFHGWKSPEIVWNEI